MDSLVRENFDNIRTTEDIVKYFRSLPKYSEVLKMNNEKKEVKEDINRYANDEIKFLKQEDFETKKKKKVKKVENKKVIKIIDPIKVSGSEMKKKPKSVINLNSITLNKEDYEDENK